MNRQIKSNRLNVNAGIMAWYVKELKKLTKQMTSECTKELAGIYKNLGYQTEFATDDSISSQTRIALNQLYKKYGDKFSERSKALVKSLLKKTNRYSNNQINEAIKSMVGANAKDFMLKGSAISPEKSEIMKALLFNNVSLIKSIPDEYFKQITGAVARSIETGEGVKWLQKQLMSYGAKSERRAELIAQDQTRKAYNDINLRNFQESGITKFEWVHSGGGREPREYHKDVLNGQIFDVATGAPNESGKKPEYIYPGQEPYCRCIMKAVLSFED